MEACALTALSRDVDPSCSATHALRWFRRIDHHARVRGEGGLGMRRKSRWSSTLVRERISVHAMAAVRTVRVKIIGEVADSHEGAAVAAKQRFAKTQSFLGVLPRFDESLPSSCEAVHDGSVVAGERAEVRHEAAPSTRLAQDAGSMPERREHEAHAPRGDPDRSTTLRVKAVKPGRVRQLWRRQTPLFAFFLAASLCVLSLLVVSWLAP